MYLLEKLFLHVPLPLNLTLNFGDFYESYYMLIFEPENYFRNLKQCSWPLWHVF